jgi:hypothetical protein
VVTLCRNLYIKPSQGHKAGKAGVYLPKLGILSLAVNVASLKVTSKKGLKMHLTVVSCLLFPTHHLYISSWCISWYILYVKLCTTLLVVIPLSEPLLIHYYMAVGIFFTVILLNFTRHFHSCLFVLLLELISFLIAAPN